MSENTVERAVDLLTRRNRYIEADRIFQEIGNRVSWQANLQRLQRNISYRAAEASLQAREYEGARRAAQRAVAANPKDYRAHLLLGRILVGLSPSGAPSEDAEKELLQAVGLADQEPEVWVALLQYLKHSGQAETEKAKQTLQQAEKKF